MIICFGIANLFNLEELSVADGATNAVAATFGISGAAALAFLMFNLFSPPCFAAIGAMNAELKSKKWLFAGIGLQLYVGYTIGFLVFFFGTLIEGVEFASVWMPVLGWSIVAVSSAAIVIVALLNRRKLAKAENSTESKCNYVFN